MLSSIYRKSFKRIGWVCLVSAIVAISTRNTLAKLAIEHIGGFVLGNSIDIENVSIGFNQIEVTNFRVLERQIRNVPQIEIEYVRIAPSLLKGICNGSWVQLLVVDQPCLHVRLDSDGKLLSTFPRFSSGSQPINNATLKLPHLAVSVRDASLVIHQQGKETLTIAGVDLVARINDEVNLEINVKELLDSSLKLRCKLDSKTLVGQTQVSLESMCIDTCELSGLAAVPTGIELAQVRATLGATLHIEHPGKEAELWGHAFALHAELTEVTGLLPSLQSVDSLPSDTTTLLADRISFRATNTNGHFKSLVQSQLLGGQVSIQVAGDLSTSKPTCLATVQVSELQIEELARRFVPHVPLRAIAKANGHLTATWMNNSIAFEGGIEQEIAKLHVDELICRPLTATAYCHGAIPNLARPQLEGELQLEAQCLGVELAELSERYNVSSMQGSCGFAARLHIPLADILNPRSYSAEAHIRSSQVRAEGCQLEPIDVKLGLNSGEILVEVPSVAMSTLQISQRPELSFANKFSLLESSRVQFALLATTAWDQVLSPTAWTGKAALQAIDFGMVGEKFSDVQLTATLAGGAFSIADTEFGWRDSQLTIGAQGSVTASEMPLYLGANLELHFDSQPIALSQVAAVLNRFAPQQLHLGGSARTSGIVAFELPSGKFAAKGDLRLSETQFNSTPIGAAQLTWVADSQSLHLLSQSKNFLGGIYSVDAKLACLDWTQATVETNFQGIQIRSLCELAKLPATATGSIDGQLRVNSIRSLSESDLILQIASRNASVRGVPVQFKTQDARIQDGKLSLQALASALDGSFNLAASGSVQALVDWSQSPNRELHRIPLECSLVGQNISIQKGVEVVDRRGALRPLSGQLEVRILRDEQAAATNLLATAETTLSNIRWQQSILTSRIRTSAAVFPTHVEVKNIEGRIAEGRLSGQASVTLEKNPKGTFRLGIENVNLRRAAAPVPGLSRSLDGKASISATGKIGRQSRASIKVQASSIRAGEVEVRELRLPLTVEYNLFANRVDLQCQAGAINAGGGYVFIDTSASWANGLTNGNATLDIRRIDSSKLLRGNALNIGMIDGKLDFRCVRAQRLEDLSGKYHLELTELQNLELPGYDRFTQLVKVPTFSGPSLGKDDIGILDGRIGGGLLYLDQATLTKNGLLVLADGTVTKQGRLALNVVAITNPSGATDGLMDLASSPILLATPAPVALIARANEAIKDRTFYVQVAGTTNRPIMHIQPGKGLTQDALRFVLSTTLGTQASNVALNRNAQLR